MSGVCLQDFEGHTLQIWSVAFSPDGQNIASGSIQTMKHPTEVHAIAFSPNLNRKTLPKLDIRDCFAIARNDNHTLALR